MGDGAAPRRFPSRALEIDVDPLVIARGVGERVDPLLRDLEPVTYVDFLADPALQILEQ